MRWKSNLPQLILLVAIVAFLGVVIILFSSKPNLGLSTADRDLLPLTALNRNTRQPSKKILFMTASYTLSQYASLWQTLENMREICESGWEVDINIQVSNDLNYSNPLLKQLQSALYCMRTASFINITVVQYGKISFGLNSRHRLVMSEFLDFYDYFIYAEEDMLLPVSSFLAFLEAENDLKQMFPNSWMRIIPGFLRYEVNRNSSLRPDAARVTWEYMPDKIHLVSLHERKYIVTNNLNQAIFILSRDRVKYLQKTCDFLSKPGRNAFYIQLRKALYRDWKYLSVGVSEWSSSFQTVLQCGVWRIIPAKRWQLFMLRHGTDKAQSRRLVRELLSFQDWQAIVDHQRVNMSLEEVYNTVIYNQYNLHLLNHSALLGEIKYQRWD